MQKKRLADRMNGFLRPGVAGIVVASALLIGCDGASNRGAKQSTKTNNASSSTAKTGTDQHGDPAASTPVVTKPMLEGWEQPRAVLVFSGEQHGYVEPCGCSETQSGGLARRHDLFQQLAARGWPAAGLDLGGSLKRARKQSELKFAFTHRALADMNYAGFAFGPEELRMGPDFLFTAFSEAAADERANVPFVSANVVFYGSRDLGTPKPFNVFDIGGVRVGVTSIIGETYAAGLVTDETLLSIENPTEALNRVVPELEAAQPEITVLLSHAPPEESKALAEAFPQFDIVVTAEGPEDPLPDAEMIGNTKLLRVSQKGKSVGVIGVYGEGDTQELKYELVNLDKDRFKTSLAMVAHMQTYQDAIADLDLAGTEMAVAHPAGTGFVGARACGQCHRKAYKIWSGSKHSKAFESLAHGRPGMYAEEWVDRQKDPECLACHVTGWAPRDVLRFEGGFVSEEATPHLAAQGCENCHGPGQAHYELEMAFQRGGDLSDDLKQARASMKLDKATAKANLCVKCHDLDNSPKFDFDLYWPKVQHVGRD